MLAMLLHSVSRWGMQCQGIRKWTAWGAAGLVSMLAAAPAEAEVPRVAVDLPAVHSLVSAVMGDLGEPEFLLQPGASPHSYQMRPSEARTLERAEILFWVSGTLSPWLAEAIATLNPEAESVELMEAPATRRLEFRQTAVFGEGGAGGHGHHGHSDHHSHGESGPGELHADSADRHRGSHGHREPGEKHGNHQEHRPQEEESRKSEAHAEHAEHGHHGDSSGHGHHAEHAVHGEHGDPSAHGDDREHESHGSHREHEEPPHGSAEKDSRHGHGLLAELPEEGEHEHHGDEHGPHGDGAGGHGGHGAAHAPAEPGHAEPDPKSHGHEHGGRSHKVGGHELLHAHEGIDPHAWLDPVNGMVWLGVIAGVLAERDPAHAAVYEANAAAAREEIEVLLAELEATLRPIRGRGFVVFHDSFQYFENRFGLEAVGAISFADASAPGPRRLQEVREAIAEAGVRCVLAEPQFDPGLVETVAEGQGVRVREIDPLGVGLEPGPGLYADLLEGVADTLAICLRE